jgi:hypothetical protein
MSNTLATATPTVTIQTLSIKAVKIDMAELNQMTVCVNLFKVTPSWFHIGQSLHMQHPASQGFQDTGHDTQAPDGFIIAPLPVDNGSAYHCAPSYEQD